MPKSFEHSGSVIINIVNNSDSEEQQFLSAI